MSDNLDVQSVVVKAQKKILGKFNNRKFVSKMMDEVSARVLDNMYRLAKEYSDKKTAEKVTKHLIKTVIKIGILYNNNQYSKEEIVIAEKFRRKFNTLIMTVVSFYTVDYTYDGSHLIKGINECRNLVKSLVQRHLTEKSLNRIDNFFDFYSNDCFLDTAFKVDGPHSTIMNKIINDVNALLEDRIIWFESWFILYF